MSPRNCVRVSMVFVAAALSVSAGFSQGRGGTTGGGAGAGGGGATGTTGGGSTGGTGTTTPGIGRPSPTTPSTNPNTQPQARMQQPIFVSGQVLLEDGTPPTESVAIERVCGGQSRTEGYTDSKGYFSLELGRRNNGVLVDASEDNSAFSSGSLGGVSPTGGTSSGMGSMGMGDNRFMNCDLRARLAGYRSQIVSLATRRALDNPDVGIILMHRIGASEGGTVSAVSLAAPKDARKAYEKGMDLLKKKKTDECNQELPKSRGAIPQICCGPRRAGQAADGARRGGAGP